MGSKSKLTLKKKDEFIDEFMNMQVTRNFPKKKSSKIEESSVSNKVSRDEFH
jgi:hypothetical protein